MIVSDALTFEKLGASWKGPVACDTETYGQIYDQSGRKLLGLSFSDSNEAFYVPIWHFEDNRWANKCSPELHDILVKFLTSTNLVGHNFTYDKRWIEAHFGIQTNWVADTRIMWHLSAAPSGPRPYGLKDAQKEVLGWAETNEDELKINVTAKGGSLSKGEHYLADLHILAKYAALDALSTAQLYGHLGHFFENNQYWWMLEKMMEYNLLLDKNTYNGILVNVTGLEMAHKRLLNKKEAALKRLNKGLKHEVHELEQAWADRRIAEYKREYNKTWYANHPEEWKRFNWNSDKDKRELFYDKLQESVRYTTESGLPAIDADSVKQFAHPFVGDYLTYEKANTLSTNFSGPYLASTVGGRLHPGFNICGTVSYRLSGFKPYLLNAPFDERYILRNLRCDEGYIGVHADLSAIEPTITAHFSEDASLLKVFRQGLGDIYLDLALELFPFDKELKEGYDPNKPVTKAVKDRFAKQRKVAKVIQLAVQYTGTGFTVAKNLTKGGIPASVGQADGYVRAYWRKFAAVARFERELRALNRQQGYLRNVIGRIIRVPNPDYKDLSNRFIQSSAHDCLVLWALAISRLARERSVDMLPMLLDCHDSTSWQVRSDQVEQAESIFIEALEEVNKELDLCVTIKMEMKRFTTLGGLKGE